MTLSFIVPAHDEELLLPATLAAIRAATAIADEACEVIVVDDASRDATAAVAERAGARVLHVEKRQIAAARNAGADAAAGAALFFVDADTLITREVVRAAVEALDAGAVGGGAAVRFDEPLPPWSRLVVPPLVWLYRRLRLAGGCFLFCDRTHFEAVGGFDPALYAGEEVFLSRALRRRGRFVLLEEEVTTSGRKLRTHSPWRLLALTTRIAMRPRRALRNRRRLGLWYAPRRRDPRFRSSSGEG